MFFARGRENASPYYNLLGILKLENIYRLKVSLFTYKLKNDKSNTPAVLLNILKPAFTHIIPGMLQIKTSLSHQYALIMVCLGYTAGRSLPPFTKHVFQQSTENSK